MKIVYLANSAIPSRSANALHVMKMCNQFANIGHRVTLITLYKKVEIEKEVDNLFDFYGVEENFKIYRIPLLTTRFKKLYSYFIAFMAFLLRPDLAYGRNFDAIDLTAKLGLKSVYEGHHFFLEKAPKRAKERFMRFLKHPNNVLMVLTSNSLLESYTDEFELRIPTLVVHNGADEVIFTPKSINIFKANYLNVGYLGHLYAGKGMEIISELVKQCPFAFFHIVGGTEQDIEHWKDVLKGCDNVCFYGFKPHAETEAYRQEMDVLLAPYLTNVKVTGGGFQSAKWMTPIKLFEYMASGKAIVSSSLPVAKEVIVDWQNGVLCNPEKIQEWVETLHRLHNSEVLRQHLGKNALATFKKDLSWKARAEKISAVLKQL